MQVLSADFGDGQQTLLLHPCCLRAKRPDSIGIRRNVEIAAAHRIGGKAMTGLKVIGQRMVGAKRLEERLAAIREARKHAGIAQGRQDMPRITPRSAPSGLARFEHGDGHARFRQMEGQRRSRQPGADDQNVGGQVAGQFRIGGDDGRRSGPAAAFDGDQTALEQIGFTLRRSVGGE